MIDITFGERMSAARIEKGLTQKALAQKLNVSPMRISHYESNSREPNIDCIKKISAALQVRPDWLLGLSNTKTTADNDDGFSIADKRIAEINQAMLNMTEEDVDRFYTVFKAVFGKQGK